MTSFIVPCQQAKFHLSWGLQELIYKGGMERDLTALQWSHGRHGKLLVWAVTCSSTFAPSYQAKATSEEAGSVVTSAESKKRVNYRSHCFKPVRVEISWTIGQATLALLKELGHRAKRASGEKS